MPRFYVSAPHPENDLLTIGGNEARHIRQVLRLRTGDEIIVFDGSGKEYEGTIVEEGPTSVLVSIRNVFPPKKEFRLEITLAQSLLKGEKMDYVIQKATELGVRKIIPFFSSRSIPFLDRSKRLERHRRWERIAIEASKQCGRRFIPKIEAVQDYHSMLSQAFRSSLPLILWEKEGKRLKEILKGSKNKKDVFSIVGPEGGLSPEEVETSKTMGFVSVNMGERILRAETSSLCLISILQYEWGDIG
jgi:16S rRNA (uracil1498-N3)-methyltransferase